MYHPLDQNSQESMHSISVLSSMPFTTLRSVFPHPSVTQKHARQSSHLIATITYQFTTSVPEIRFEIWKAVGLDPPVLRLSLDLQI